MRHGALATLRRERIVTRMGGNRVRRFGERPMGANRVMPLR